MKGTISSVFALLLMWACQVNAQEFWLGADISSVTELEAQGHKWYNWQGEERECTALMKEMGMNAIRLRVWVDPSKHGNWCNKEDVLAKALRAKQLGMEVMIDFHYSDWWADPAKQPIPASWDGLPYKKMLKALADHTTEVLTLLKQNGITPRWVQVGNETSNGLLWSVEMDPETGWEKKDEQGNTTITKSMGHWERNPKQYGGFIRAGYDAVKKVCPEAQVIVHLDNGFDNALYNKNLDLVKEGGGKWDMIGMSLYPYWAMQSGKEPDAAHAIADCMKNIRSVAKKYQCDVMIVETGFEVDEKNPWKMQAGRKQLAEIIRKSKEDTNGHCKGVFYWEPECKPEGYKLGAFTMDGHATDIMRAFSTAQPYDRKKVELTTTRGKIVVELYNETPIHRDNFIRLAESGALENTLFHRVISNFMIQGGDPTTVDAPPTTEKVPAAPYGNNEVPTVDGEKTLPAEIIFPQAFHKRGALAAARESDEENPEMKSSSSQFYIVWGTTPAKAGTKPYVQYLPFYNEYGNAGTPWLDGGYTVFGEVVEGLEIVERIQAAATDSYDRPLQDIKLLKMRVIE